MAEATARVLETSRSKAARLRPVPVTAVKLKDEFWRWRLEQNLAVSIPHLYTMLQEHGVVRNFKRAAGEDDSPREGALFTDSDLYKWVEAAAWALASGESKEVRAQLEEAISAIESAQEEDGYLNTFHRKKEERWSNVVSNHELYCAGHLFEAAVALQRCLGDERLLEVSKRFADYIASVFGPGKREDWPGHPEIELALVKLYRATGERRYLELAGFFLERMKFTERREMWGHAVRMGYFAAGGVDYFLETGDEAYGEAAQRLWRSLVDKKLYITGASASRYVGESYGQDHELPMARAYAESCAGISNLFFALRLLQAEGEAEYADLVERVAYNHLLASISLDGERYFYMNPLADTGKGEPGMWYPWAEKAPYERTAWHSCTCCPPNIQRTIAQLPGYVYGVSEAGVWVHLYVASEAKIELPDGKQVKLEQVGGYPWSGRMELKVKVEEAREFALYLRIPGWADWAKVQVKGETAQVAVPGSYHEVRRRWEGETAIEVEFPVRATFWEANTRVSEARGQVAVQRGPLVYCLEGPDNPGVDLAACEVDVEAPVEESWEGDLLKGVVTLRLHGQVEAEGEGPLYVKRGRKAAKAPVELKAIPYYAWNNRGPAQMQVWSKRSE